MIRKTELPTTGLDQILLNVNLQCVYMHIAEQKDKWECSSHIHDYLEIGYIYKGTGQYQIDNDSYVAEMGDLFVIPSKVSHYEINNPDSPFQIVFLMIKFNGVDSDLFYDIILSLQGKIQIDNKRKVKELYDNIMIL